MAHGGYREGAGRKPGLPDLKTRDLRDLIKKKELIEKLQCIALSKEGDPTVAEIIRAIDVLLAKCVPDLQTMKVEGDQDKPLGVILYPAKKNPGEN